MVVKRLRLTPVGIVLLLAVAAVAVLVLVGQQTAAVIVTAVGLLVIAGASNRSPARDRAFSVRTRRK